MEDKSGLKEECTQHPQLCHSRKYFSRETRQENRIMKTKKTRKNNRFLSKNTEEMQIKMKAIKALNSYIYYVTPREHRSQRWEKKETENCILLKTGTSQLR